MFENEEGWLKAIFADPRNTVLKTQYEDWLIARGSQRGPGIKAIRQAEEEYTAARTQRDLYVDQAEAFRRREDILDEVRKEPPPGTVTEDTPVVLDKDGVIGWYRGELYIFFRKDWEAEAREALWCDIGGSSLYPLIDLLYRAACQK